MVVAQPRVEFNAVSKRYPGVQALDSVTFSVAPGAVHGVVGENGAGKSTLMRILAGAAHTDQGCIHIDGILTAIRSTRHAQTLGIATVYQEFSLVPDLTVAENVFLGRWPQNALGLISFRKLYSRTRQLLDTLAVGVDPRGRVRDLSVAHQQMVEIARALSWHARVLILDEPSAVLTPTELSSLFDLVRLLAKKGVSVLYISHRLEEVFELCTAVTVLRDGCHISTRPIAEVRRPAMIQEMVGRPITEEFPPREATASGVVLRVERLSSSRRFRNVSFEVRGGEVFALAGLVGSGRTSVGKTLSGALRATRGKASVNGVPALPRSPRCAHDAGIAYLPEDRKREGLLLHRPLRENVTLSHLQSVSRVGFLNLKKEKRLAREGIRELQIRAKNEDAVVSTLSGGNQQKVMIARWLLRSYSVIILDEPTRGVDVGAKVEIYRLINRMAERGTAIVIITSELPEAIGMADRIGVMARGELTGVLENAKRDVSQEQVLRLAIGSKDTYGPLELR